jgi:hypothetical protein
MKSLLLTDWFRRHFQGPAGSQRIPSGGSHDSLLSIRSISASSIMKLCLCFELLAGSFILRVTFTLRRLKEVESLSFSMTTKSFSSLFLL